MNFKTLFYVFSCLFAAHGPVMGNPVKMKPGFYDPQNPDKSLAFPDFLIPRTEYPIRPKVCMYKGGEYSDGTVVTTDEPCLKCKCLGGSLICYLRVCPTLPDPPPPQCLLVLRKGACCSELVCEDSSVTTNHISRAEPSNDVDHPLDSTISFGDGKGCIDNGTLYASGSAMSTSSLCEYCYCISGAQHCVKPRCLLPVKGCQPTRSPHSCCPVSYNCEQNQTSTTTTTLSSLNKQDGCFVNETFYPEGERVSVKESPCTNCFCIRGKVKCANLSCAPPLLGCTPIIQPGRCCASGYNCTLNEFNNIKSSNEVHPVLVTSDTIDDNQDVTINERSFPGDTLLTPSQIAEILLGTEKRSTRNNDSEKQKGDKKNSKIAVSIITTPEEMNETKQVELTKSNASQKTSSKSTTTDVHSAGSELKNNTKIRDVEDTSNPTNSEHGNKEDKNDTAEDSSKHKFDLMNPKSKPSNENISHLDQSEKNATESTGDSEKLNDDSMVDEDYTSLSTVIINDSINCTTEITAVEDTDNSTESVTFESTTQNNQLYNDTQERRPSTLESIDADSSTSDDEDIIHENSTQSNIHRGSQFPSHSLIIPKDDDVFMVNVSTFVRTNTSVVTLRPVAAIPPEIEAILNMSMKNQKDDYFDYDYKSALPPSLPNLEIIPFLATDAVVKEKKSEKKKTNTKYENAFPPVESKNYIDKFSPTIRDKFNATVYPYVTPTTFPSYLDDKYIPNPPVSNYNRNPVYKQHIEDKFLATTYSSLNNNYDNMPFAQEKYDSLPIDDTKTEATVFDINGVNLFSPPVKTEGGFLPREPPIDSYYDLGFSSTGEGSYSATDSSLMVTNHAKITGDNCISNGREYKNRELITEPHACVVCFCYYGDIHCQDPECPPIKPGCRRIIEKGSSSCCGIEICNDEAFDSHKKAEHQNTDATDIKSTTQTSTYRNNVDITPIFTLPTTENTPYNTRKTTTETPEIASTIGTISTFVVPSKLHIITTTEVNNTSTTSTTTTPSTTETIASNKTSIDAEELIRPINKRVDETSAPENTANSHLPTSEDPLISVTENEVVKETVEENYETDPFSEESDDDDGFNFDSVLKYLLGDDSTTKPPPKSTSKLYYTSPKPTSVEYFISPKVRGYSPTTVMTFSSTPTISSSTPRSTTVTTERIISTQRPTYKVTSSLIPFKLVSPTNTSPTPAHKHVHKFTYSKPSRNVTIVPQYKNITIPRLTTKAPPSYSTLHRFTKLKFSPTPFPLTTESVKKIAPPSYPKDQFHQTYKRKPSPSSDSTLPFGAGLLKLAGCNIYGRMYRVGKIISELSGPCLQCMCTEVGVQCKSVSNSNCS